jgi:hypothetical protein
MKDNQTNVTEQNYNEIWCFYGDENVDCGLLGWDAV